MLSPSFIREAASEFGSSTIVVSIDVKKNWRGKKNDIHQRRFAQY